MELKGIGRSLAGLIAAVFFSLCLTGPPTGLAASGFEPDRQNIRIGVDINTPPYSYVDSSGMIKGFHVDLVRAVALEIGVDIALYAQTAKDLNSNLLNHGLDAIITNQPADSSLLPSRGLIKSQDAIFVRADNQYIADLAGLWVSPVAINTQSLTSLISSYMDKYTVESPRIVMSQEHGFLLLMNGEVDSYIGNKSAGMYLIQRWNQEDYIKAVGEAFNISTYSFYTNAADKALMSQLNQGLAAVLEGDSYDKIYEKWFGESAASYNKKIKNVLLATALAAIALIFLFSKWRRALKKEVDQRDAELYRAHSKEQLLQEEMAKVDRMKSLDLLVSEFVHEIRTPLTSIKTMAEMLPSKIDKREFRHNLTEIMTMEVSRLDSMVSSLSEYAKPKQSTNHAFSVKVLLDSVLLLLQRKCDEKKIDVEVSVADDLIVYGDFMELMQVLINLILNSLESLGTRGCIAITGARSSDEGIDLIVKDDGPGIPEEHLEKVITPFYTTRPEGTGLGLYICCRLLEKNQGWLALKSAPGQGVTATMHLPAYYRERGRTS